MYSPNLSFSDAISGEARGVSGHVGDQPHQQHHLNHRAGEGAMASTAEHHDAIRSCFGSGFHRGEDTAVKAWVAGWWRWTRVRL